MPNAATLAAQPTTVQSAQAAWTTLAACRAYLEQGQVNQAAQVLDQLDQNSTGPNHRSLQFAAMNTLGELCVKQGKLHLAAATYQFLLDWVDTQPCEAELFRFYWGLSALYYEWNQLEKAKQYLQGAIDTLEQKRLPACWAVAGQVQLAWVHWAQGNAALAQSAWQQALLAARAAADPLVLRRVTAEQARFWLRQGKLTQALGWAEECEFEPADPVNYSHQFEQLTLARLLLATGRSAQALPLLQRLRHAAKTAGRSGDLIEILVLRALAFGAQGDVQHAWTELAQALCRAEREEYTRAFVDEGAPVVDLLHHTAAKGVTLIYIKNLLAIFATAPATSLASAASAHSPAPAHTTLVEPLTLRERDVLRLVAGGQANDEIAQALSIAPTTVKKHLGNIFGKLNAKNRTEAVAKARAAELL